MPPVYVVTAKSNLPSKSKSPIAIAEGLPAIATLDANVKFRLPNDDALRNTDTVFESKSAVAISGFPSPSKSPIASPKGVEPTTISFFGLKPRLPNVDTFRKTDTLPPAEFTVARSGFPSKSKS